MRPRPLNAVLAAALMLLAGCSEYLDRRDTIALGAGNSVEANLALQASDPFPPYRNVTAIRTDGKRAEAIVRRYQTNTSGALATPDSGSSDGESSQNGGQASQSPQ